jgi:hypothetical protein
MGSVWNGCDLSDKIMSVYKIVDVLNITSRMLKVTAGKKNAI